MVHNFDADVAAEFNGLTKGGKFDIAVKGEAQYAEFEDSVQKTSSCLGGDPRLASPLGSDPSSDSVFETFKEWVNTTHTRPNVMSFQTMTLWDLMSGANDSEVAARGTDVQDAFSWIVENPEEHQTKARLTITSDWGEIGLLTPSAFILRDPAHPPPTEAFFSSTKITWTSNSASQRFVEIECVSSMTVAYSWNVSDTRATGSSSLTMALLSTSSSRTAALVPPRVKAISASHSTG